MFRAPLTEEFEKESKATKEKLLLKYWREKRNWINQAVL
jgi:hypothetical protein